MNISSYKSLPELFLEKTTKYLKLKKQFNVNWKAAAVADDKRIEKVSSASKIYFNQIANRCERQIKIFYRKLL